MIQAMRRCVTHFSVLMGLMGGLKRAGALICHDLDWLEARHDWPGLNSMFKSDSPDALPLTDAMRVLRQCSQALVLELVDRPR